MSLEESFIQKLHALPPDKQREAVDFVEFLHHKTMIAKSVRRTIKGLWSDLGIDISDQDIAKARSENWGGFPREGI